MSLDVDPEAYELARLAAALVLLRQTDTGAWRKHARPEQLPPDGAWTDWYIRGGRGSGKTWAAAHALAELINANPGGDWAVIAPTYGDGRDTCVEGPSGLLVALGPDRVRAWNRSMGELQLTNGGTVFVDGADDGALRVQGKNLRGVWADEVGLWKLSQWKRAWEESIGFAVRMSPAIRIATGTPKRGHPLPRMLATNEAIEQSLLLTEDNIANLDPAVVARWQAQYAGTTLGRQELGGELLDDLEGALWNRGLIRYRPHVELQRIVVGLDPNASNDPGADTAGIVVAGRGVDGLCYVLEDRTAVIGPLQWARQAIDAVFVHGADCVVAEGNNGGEMVRITLGTVDPRVRVKIVHASRGKQARAEPIVALYEQSKVFHVEPMPELEDEMCLVAGTLIETDYGQAPIEDVRPGVRVMTRDGYATVGWAGQTGVATRLVEVRHSGGCVYSTAWHPFLLDREFASAKSARRGQRLDVSPRWDAMARPSHGVADGGDSVPRVTTDTPRANNSTVLSTQLITARSHPAFWSIIATMTPDITHSGTFYSSLPPSTRPSTGTRDGRYGAASSVALLDGLPGFAASLGVTDARPVATASYPSRCAPSSVPSGVPVYNLRVDDGLPEFYANGVLVHNCNWDPREGGISPGRIDALVWALTDLALDDPWAGATGSSIS